MFDQRDFFLATPAFELLFASDGLIDVLKWFEADKTCAAVVPCEAGDRAALVLVHSPPQIVGDTAVENMCAACHEVDVKAAFIHQRDGSTHWLSWHVTKETAGPSTAFSRVRGQTPLRMTAFFQVVMG